jgi:hypothetical protein
MTSRFFRFAILVVLLLLTAQVAQPYIFRLMYSETTPKPVVPRGNLSEAEQATSLCSIGFHPPWFRWSDANLAKVPLATRRKAPACSPGPDLSGTGQAIS